MSSLLNMGSYKGELDAAGLLRSLNARNRSMLAMDLSRYRPEPAWNDLFIRLASDSSPEVRYRFQQSVSSARLTGDSYPVLNVLLQALDGSPYGRDGEVLDAIRAIGDTAIPQLAISYKESRCPDGVLGVLFSFSPARYPVVRALLDSAFYSRHPGIRLAALKYLEDHRDESPRYLSQLEVQMIDDPRIPE